MVAILLMTEVDTVCKPGNKEAAWCAPALQPTGPPSWTKEGDTCPRRARPHTCPAPSPRRPRSPALVADSKALVVACGLNDAYNTAHAVAVTSAHVASHGTLAVALAAAHHAAGHAAADIALHGATSATCTAAGKVAGNAGKLSVDDATLGVREAASELKKRLCQ